MKIETTLKALKAQDWRVLAKTMTMVESQRSDHRLFSWDLMKKILCDAQLFHHSKVIGISGPPGVGKSSFLEAFVPQLLEKGLKVAILSIDPSSQMSGGSILGDKTRMTQLAAHPHCFIRPSPAGAKLGGISSKTREMILLCRYFAFDYIFVETVGVGQSEVEVAQVVDYLAMLISPGAGDDLQGIKKGILENIHLLIVHKADADKKVQTQTTCHHYQESLKVLNVNSVPVLAASSLEKTGLVEVLNTLEQYFANYEWSAASQFEFVQNWLKIALEEQFLQQFRQNQALQKQLATQAQSLLNGKLDWPDLYNSCLQEMKLSTK